VKPAKELSQHPADAQGDKNNGSEKQAKVSLRMTSELADVTAHFGNVTLDVVDISFELVDSLSHTPHLNPKCSAFNETRDVSAIP
jgi:hypothetical protein